MTMNIQAVITGDISRFTTLNPLQRKQLVSKTETLLMSMTVRKRDARMFRGDSYQMVTTNVDLVLWHCVRLVCWFKLNGKHAADADGIANQRKKLGTRISVGVGVVEAAEAGVQAQLAAPRVQRAVQALVTVAYGGAYAAIGTLQGVLFQHDVDDAARALAIIAGRG